jgi:hypothetical protein
MQPSIALSTTDKSSAPDYQSTSSTVDTAPNVSVIVIPECEPEQYVEPVRTWWGV